MPMNKSKIIIDIESQSLKLYERHHNQDKLQKVYSISTGKNGTGCQEGTGKTPLGQHVIANKIGADKAINSVFVARVATGEIYSEQLAKQAPHRDWILSRILWLAGVEAGINQGNNAKGCCDTYQRYIYIHGTPDSEPMGIAQSHGCIRMRNADIIELFEQVEEGTPVEIL